MLYKDVYVCLIASSMNDVLFSPSCRMIVAFTYIANGKPGTHTQVPLYDPVPSMTNGYFGNTKSTFWTFGP